MTQAKPLSNEPTESDGRRLRSIRNRERIVAALIKLVHEGNYIPTAQEISIEAGISLRSVFRHIDDMDSLYREITQAYESNVLALIDQPFRGKTWRERLDESIGRRRIVFEQILAVKTSGDLRRFGSEFLMNDYERFVEGERQRLMAILPKFLQKPGPRLDALQLVLSFQSWQRLRHDQDATPDETEAAIRFAVQKIIA